jgi:hypothetical protein
LADCPETAWERAAQAALFACLFAMQAKENAMSGGVE